MIIDFKEVRKPWVHPPYPPYHRGLYMEEYFYSFYKNNKDSFDSTGYTLIPIFWTTAYLYQIQLQPYINALPKDKKYFCISQHDDGVKEKLPEGTKVFAAGGNSGGIPLPLVCSPIQDKEFTSQEKDIFCSFVGSLTHDTRHKMVEELKGDKLFYIKTGDWGWEISKQNELHFLKTISRSKFTLCPRGYGAQSFRFYEALQLGSIPIYVHDDIKWLPYSDILNWSDFSIVIHINNIKNLKHMLLSLSEDKVEKMKEAGRIAYNNFFRMENLPNQILERLKK